VWTGHFVQGGEAFPQESEPAEGVSPGSAARPSHRLGGLARVAEWAYAIDLKSMAFEKGMWVRIPPRASRVSVSSRRVVTEGSAWSR
jgi:hypothetical protein